MSDDEFDDEDRLELELIYKLKLENHSRYELQAKRLLQNFKLRVFEGDCLFNYQITGDGCSVEISKDGGASFRELGWTRFRPSSANENFNLQFIFATSEARAILNT